MSSKAKPGGRTISRGDPALELGSWTPRVAVVSYLNALPLIDGLVGDDRIRLVRDVPSRLAAKLTTGRLDAALLPSIELQRLDEPPVLLPAGCIASEGPTMTARIFSRVAPLALRRLHVDPDSRSSVALAEVVWAESFSRDLQTVPWESPAELVGPHRPQAVLFIGDKVVIRPPKEYAWEIDLGAAWEQLTGLPFVFAVWAMRVERGVSADVRRKRGLGLHHVLTAARQRGMARIEEIAGRYGPRLGWSAAEAGRYLTEQIQYKFTQRHREGMETFFKLAHKHGLIKEMTPVNYLDV